MVALLLVGSAQAVHDEQFQLDGNVLANVAPPGNTAPFDWSSFFNASGQKSPVLPDPSRPGFDASGFERDFLTNPNGSFNTSDGSTFATGSKDTLPITPGWQCNFDNNVNSKTDVMNAYAVSFTNSLDEEILYFALERNANTGTGNVGFWFLQDEVACESTGGTTAFTGDHTDGDLLIVSEFSQGGTVATIAAYQWVGGANGFLDPNPVAGGGSCSTALAGDSICAIVNTGTITTPWPTSNKQDGPGNSLRVSEFFEAGLNLTKEGLGGKCFNTFIGDTRSSTSLTATIFDFSLGQLGECVTTLTTQANKAASSSIGTGTVSSGTDTATLTITGADNWGGTLSWYLCGPLTPPGGNVPQCDKTLGLLVTSRTVNQSSPASDFVSGTASITEVGTYCWTAHFEPNQASKDAGVDPADDTGANECFMITPVTPTVTTASVQPLELLSPTIFGGLADLNGDGAGSSDPTPDDGAAFYGDTRIIGGMLDCNNWVNDPVDPVNSGLAGDGVIDSSDNCELLGYDGSPTGVTITVTAGAFQVPDGTALPAIFPDPATPTNNDIGDSKFAWSSRFGRVDANGDEDATTGDDCSINIVNSFDILGSVCQGYTIPQGNGLVDLNDDGKITGADSCSTGCFLGHKVSSGFVVAGPVPFGSAIYDVALLSGTSTRKATNGIDTNYPSIICDGDSGAPAGTNVCTAAGTSNGPTTGGKITFTLKGPGSAPPCPATTDNHTPPDPNPQDVSPISLGVDAAYGPVQYTPGAPGTYYWQAQYFVEAGDANNNNSALHNANCDVSGETVVVQQIPTEISTTQKVIPQDSATITSSASGDNIPAGGTVTFYLYAGDTAANNLANCQAHGTTVGSGGLVYSQAFPTDTTPAHSETFNSNNTVAVDANTTVYWRVTYATGDTAHTGRQSDCAESTQTAFVNDSGPGTLFP